MIIWKGQDISEWTIALVFITTLTMVVLLSLAPHMVLTLHNITNAVHNSTISQQQQ